MPSGISVRAGHCRERVEAFQGIRQAFLAAGDENPARHQLRPIFFREGVPSFQGSIRRHMLRQGVADWCVLRTRHCIIRSAADDFVQAPDDQDKLFLGSLRDFLSDTHYGKCAYLADLDP